LRLFRKRREAKLQAERRRQDVAELRDLATRLPDGDGAISPDGFREFVEFATNHHIGLDTVPDLREAVRVGFAQGGYFLETETSLLLKDDETPLLDAPVELLKEVAEREFHAGSAGLSIPLGGGMRYRLGATRGQMVTIGTQWTTADTGTLTVTSRRVVYHGRRKTLEFAFAKLATISIYAYAVNLGVTNRQSTSSFRTGDPQLVAGIIHAAFNHRDKHLTIVRLTPAEIET
jgi:hypothetical protein